MQQRGPEPPPTLRQHTFSLKFNTARFSPAFAHRCSASMCEVPGVFVPLGRGSLAIMQNGCDARNNLPCKALTTLSTAQRAARAGSMRDAA